MIQNRKLPSSTQHDFARIPDANIPRSVFNLSKKYKTAFDTGYLIPILCDEALPGDTWKVRLDSVARLATPIVPFMDNLYIDYHFFAVPNRLLWTNWVKFMGEQVDPGDSIDYTVPIVTAHAVTTGLLQDYMGIPVGAGSVEYNALHTRAYNLIWNNWYRDENLQDSVKVDTGDGPDTYTDYVLLRRGKRHDYFTSCLPWPIKGTEAQISLGGSADVFGDGNALGINDGTNNMGMYRIAANEMTGGTGFYGQAIGSSPAVGTGPAPSVAIGVVTSGNSGLYADLTTAVGPTVNSFRETIYLQHMLERDARGGTRYPEILRSHFNVVDPMMSVLQRPEYLGGGTAPIHITPIPQTSESGTTKQGYLAAVGYQEAEGIGFTKSFTEHCVIIGLASVRADLSYQRGLRKMWSRQTREEYYFPSLAHLGEQSVLNKEIWHQGNATDDNVFGYQERWSEYRHGVSEITGVLRSDATTTAIDEWHLAIDDATLPLLDDTFIQENPPVARVVAVPSEPEIIFSGYFNIQCARVMPTFSVPGMGTTL